MPLNCRTQHKQQNLRQRISPPALWTGKSFSICWATSQQFAAHEVSCQQHRMHAKLHWIPRRRSRSVPSQSAHCRSETPKWKGHSSKRFPPTGTSS